MPHAPASPSPQHIRHVNRSRILSEIRRLPGISRRQLALRIGLTEASLSRISRDLIAEGLVMEMEAPTDRPMRGRPNVGLWLRSDGAYVLSVTLTAYEHKFSVVGSTGERVIEGAIPGLPGASPAEVAAHLHDQVAGLGKRPDVKAERLNGVTLSLSGDIDARRGVVLRAPAIGWSDVPLAALFAETLGVPARLQSVANALHVAEVRYGDGRVSSHSLLVHAGLGLSASLMSHGLLSVGGEHESGVECILAGGSPDTPERLTDVASGRAILRRLGHLSAGDGSLTADAGLHLGLPHTIRQANAGDPRVVAVFREAGHLLARSVLSVVALVHPEQFILAGPLAAARPFADAMQEGLRAFTGLTRIAPPAFILSRTSYLRATELMGLDTFLFSRGADTPAPAGDAALDEEAEPFAVDQVRTVPRALT